MRGIERRLTSSATGLQRAAVSPLLDRFELLCEDLCDRDRITPVGKAVLLREVTRSISQRLDVEPLLTRPSGAPARVVVLTGHPRTGSTFLHHLLALDDGAYCPPMWHLVQPADALAGHQAVADVRQYLAALDRLSPDVRRLHPMGAELPDECVALLQLTGASERFLYLGDLPRYRAWLMQHDMSADYVVFRRIIEALAFAMQSRLIVLKAPAHLGRLRELRRAWPEATIVRLVRADLEVRASFGALMTATHTISSPDPSISGPATAAMLLNWHASQYATLASPADLVVEFDELVGDPLAVVAGVYETLGIVLAPQARSRMVDRLTSLVERHAGPRPGDRNRVGG